LYTQDLLDCRRELMEEMNKPKVFAYEPKTSTIKPKKGKKK
jgi:hypothetical protein